LARILFSADLWFAISAFQIRTAKVKVLAGFAKPVQLQIFQISLDSSPAVYPKFTTPPTTSLTH
jgi:hypothetical protein